MIGKELKRLRHEYGYTQKELANEIGIKSGNAISAWERSNRDLKNINPYYNARIEKVFFGEEVE